jgi:hypothetical protein
MRLVELEGFSNRFSYFGLVSQHPSFENVYHLRFHKPIFI